MGLSNKRENTLCLAFEAVQRVIGPLTCLMIKKQMLKSSMRTLWSVLMGHHVWLPQLWICLFKKCGKSDLRTSIIWNLSDNWIIKTPFALQTLCLTVFFFFYFEGLKNIMRSSFAFFTPLELLIFCKWIHPLNCPSPKRICKLRWTVSLAIQRLKSRPEIFWEISAPFWKELYFWGEVTMFEILCASMIE